MAGIPDDKVQEVRDRVDIVDLVGRYVELRRSGRNYVGLCPFHQEKSPSFNVNPALKGYKCFGCGAGGDAIRFVMELEGKGFLETIRKLAELYGVSLPAHAGGTGQGPDRNERDEAYLLMRTAAGLYRSLLLEAPEGAAGRAYLETRGVTPQAAAAFELGYAPAPSEAGWDRLARALQDKGMSSGLAQRLGLLRASERRGSVYDAFRGRLMFPVIQPGGEVIAFSGRVVPPHDVAAEGSPPPKYVNSSESFLFHKGKTLFGLAVARPAIRDKGRAILVEGNLDVVKLHQHGHGETVAPLGTSFTEDQARLLSRFTSRVVMCFDGDKAGRDAAGKALPMLLEQDLDVRLVLLPDGEDPDSLGAERFANLLADARSALEVAMTRLAAWAGDSPDARARALDRAVNLIRKVRRPSARSLYAESAAALFDVPLPRVTSLLQENPRGAAGRPGAPVQVSRAGARAGDPAADHGGPPLPPLPAAQAELTMLLVDVPHLATLAERSGALEHVDDERLRPVLQAVVASAKEGRSPTLPELLEHVDPDAQPQLLEHVFAGKYRVSDDDPGLIAPQAVLQTLLYRCQMDAIDIEIGRREKDFHDARSTGDLELQREHQLEIMKLRRKKDALRHAPPPAPGL
ncbi:DNA primase [Paraliomyxa miuraensis]|uniref:DNA primase n=1 Tax=Paraliomyxa miuraensis TaxID=376150 RepID=UPI002253F31E|nr:DNA primase [Paraliomyxa miuraensis]MCX4243540.1 DNA primase [Paraliomyxa miuraensis]